MNDRGSIGRYLAGHSDEFEPKKENTTEVEIMEDIQVDETFPDLLIEGNAKDKRIPKSLFVYMKKLDLIKFIDWKRAYVTNKGFRFRWKDEYLYKSDFIKLAANPRLDFVYGADNGIHVFLKISEIERVGIKEYLKNILGLNKKEVKHGV